MGMVEDVETVLESFRDPDISLALVVDPVGENVVIVGCDPPKHHFAKTLLGHEVKRHLEDAGFDVQLDGGLRHVPGLPPGTARGTRFSNARAYQQRDLEPPYLRVRRRG
jgi:hypothetical protein